MLFLSQVNADAEEIQLSTNNTITEATDETLTEAILTTTENPDVTSDVDEILFAYHNITSKKTASPTTVTTTAAISGNSINSGSNQKLNFKLYASLSYMVFAFRLKEVEFV